jgi:hypothetical protein
METALGSFDIPADSTPMLVEENSTSVLFIGVPNSA